MPLLHILKENSFGLLQKVSKNETTKTNRSLLSSAACRTYFTPKQCISVSFLFCCLKDRKTYADHKRKGGVGLEVNATSEEPSPYSLTDVRPGEKKGVPFVSVKLTDVP